MNKHDFVAFGKVTFEFYSDLNNLTRDEAYELAEDLAEDIKEFIEEKVTLKQGRSLPDIHIDYAKADITDVRLQD